MHRATVPVVGLLSFLLEIETHQLLTELEGDCSSTNRVDHQNHKQRWVYGVQDLREGDQVDDGIQDGHGEGQGSVCEDSAKTGTIRKHIGAHCMARCGFQLDAKSLARKMRSCVYPWLVPLYLTSLVIL